MAAITKAGLLLAGLIVVIVIVAAVAFGWTATTLISYRAAVRTHQPHLLD